MGLCLLENVHKDDLPRARQQLAHVRLPVLKGPGMPGLTMSRFGQQQDSCELRMAVACRSSRCVAVASTLLLKVAVM